MLFLLWLRWRHRLLLGHWRQRSCCEGKRQSSSTGSVLRQPYHLFQYAFLPVMHPAAFNFNFMSFSLCCSFVLCFAVTEIPLSKPCGNQGCSTLRPSPTHVHPVFSAWSPWVWSSTVVVTGNGAHAYRSSPITVTAAPSCGNLQQVFNTYLKARTAAAAQAATVQVLEQISEFKAPSAVVEVYLEPVAVADIPYLRSFFAGPEEAREHTLQTCVIQVHAEGTSKTAASIML